MDAIGILEGLIEHYSPTGQEDAAAEYLVRTMSALGYSASRDAIGNVVGVLGDGPNEIMLLGHIDTVPGQIDLRRDGDLLYGRGSVDAKGPLACFTLAAADAQVKSGWKLTVIGAVGEEGDSRGAHFLCQHYSPPAMVIIGEPSGWERLTLGYKGSAWVEYSCAQPLEHSAAQGQNACEVAAAFWNRLKIAASQYNAAYTRTFDQILPTLRSMQSIEDGFSMTASLQISLRLPPTWDQHRLDEFLSTCQVDGEIRTLDFTPTFLADKNNSLVRAFLPAIRFAGGKPSFSLKTGTSDMNLVAPLWGCPTLTYGPGDSSLDHTPQEHIHLTEYMLAIQVLTQTLNNIMDQTSSLTVLAKHNAKQIKPPITVW